MDYFIWIFTVQDDFLFWDKYSKKMLPTKVKVILISLPQRGILYALGILDFDDVSLSLLDCDLMPLVKMMIVILIH